MYLTNQGLSKFGFLISEDDLCALIQYSKIRRPYRKRASVDQTEKGIARQKRLQQTTDHTLSPDSNNLPSSIATSARVDQTENGIVRETQLQRTTDHTLNTDSNNFPSSIATSASIGQTEN